MDRRQPLSQLLRHTTLPLAAVLAIALAAIEVVIDFGTWIQLNVSILYGLPLVLAAQARSKRLLWCLVALLSVATFTVYWLQIPPGQASSLHEPYFVNRVLASAATFTTAILLHVWINAVEAMDAQQQLLQGQNEELQRRRQEAETTSAHKTQLLTSMSHDLRSPVNAIRLMAEVIRRTAEDPTLSCDIPHLSARLQQNAQSLVDFLTNMLDIAAFDSGRLVLQESEFSVNELLAEECSRLRPLADVKRLTLTWQGPEPPAWLKTDRTKLMRVVSNLLSNAIKFTEIGEVAADAALTPEGLVEIRVRDTGIGIAPDDVKRVLDGFAQLEGPSIGSQKGWGLGLAIGRRLVDLMGGTLAVESRLDVGTVFVVRLPASCVISHPTQDRRAGPGRGIPGDR